MIAVADNRCLAAGVLVARARGLAGRNRQGKPTVAVADRRAGAVGVDDICRSRILHRPVVGRVVRNITIEGGVHDCRAIPALAGA